MKNLLAFPTKGTKYCFYLRCLYAYVSDSVFPFIRAFATSGEKRSTIIFFNTVNILL